MQIYYFFVTLQTEINIFMLSLEDYFRLSDRSGYQISPDGGHFSYLAPWHDRMNVFVEDVRQNTRRQITFEEERSVEGYFWADNSRLLFVKDVGGDENFQLFGVNIDGTDLRGYTDFPGVRTMLIDDLEEVPDEIMIAMNRRNPEVFDPYRLNLKTGELVQLAENPGYWQGYLTDHEGRLRVTYAIIDGVNTQILYRDNENEDFQPVLTTNFKDSVAFLMFTPDNKNVYAATNLGRDKETLVLMNPRTCEELEVLYEHPKYDVSSLSYSRKRKKILAAYCRGHKEPVRHYFDEQEEKLREHIRGLFPGKRVGMVDCDKSETHELLVVHDDRRRGQYYYYNVLTDELRFLCDAAPWITEDDTVPMQAVTYTTRDGLEIEAYLSLPKGEGPFPCVVNPHGGPWSRDSWGYNSEAQFLCSRGYAVFKMNFRGSTGYGRKFLESSYKQWGLKMQDDITDGVKWLINSGYADEKRIAIYGGSYGGYATLAGVCFTPELYRCAIDYVGVSNLFTFMNTIPPYWRPMLEMMHEQIGDPVKDREQLEATSPALHVENIQCPLLIAQGANDPRVNKAESDQIVEALKKRGVEVEYLVKDNEGHGFHNQENRFDFYRAMEAFLKKYL